MGWITTISTITGREVLACDDCGAYPVRKHRCAFGYCQSYALCANCWAKNKPTWKAQHLKMGCREASISFNEREKERADLLKRGFFLRIAALSMDSGRVKVIFTDAEKHELAVFMSHAAYDAIPIGANAVLEEYLSLEPLQVCESLDIYEDK